MTNTRLYTLCLLAWLTLFILMFGSVANAQVIQTDRSGFTIAPTPVESLQLEVGSLISNGTPLDFTILMRIPSKIMEIRLQADEDAHFGVKFPLLPEAWNGIDFAVIPTLTLSVVDEPLMTTRLAWGLSLPSHVKLDGNFLLGKDEALSVRVSRKDEAPAFWAFGEYFYERDHHLGVGGTKAFNNRFQFDFSFGWQIPEATLYWQMGFVVR